jgi:hypothetical protein
MEARHQPGSRKRVLEAEGTRVIGSLGATPLPARRTVPIHGARAQQGSEMGEVLANKLVKFANSQPK